MTPEVLGREPKLAGRSEPVSAPPAPGGWVWSAIGVEALWAAVAMGVATLLTLGLLMIWAPGHPGVDQNGYLVGGRLLAETGRYGFVPPDPFYFVGGMWNLGPDGQTYHPKYPLGLPALYAVLIVLWGHDTGTWAGHLVSPVATGLAVLGTYTLTRAAVGRPHGRFAGVLAAILVGVSPTVFVLGNNPNSHAATLASVVWGMAGVVIWWRLALAGRPVAAFVAAGWAGLLLGWAVTIRYTEGLLLIPAGWAGVCVLLAAWRAGGWRPAAVVVGQGVVLLLAWAVPVGAMLAFNRAEFGAWTGYDTTRESTGFSWQFFVANWDLVLREMDDRLLAVGFGIAMVGLAAMLIGGRGREGSRPSEPLLAVMLLLWAVPCMVCYAAYYWAPETNNVGYARFFVTVIPALALSAAWGVTVGATRMAEAGQGLSRRRRLVAPIAAGVVVAVASACLAAQSAEQAVPEARANLVMHLASEALYRSAPPGSVVFSEGRVLHHLQFVGEYQTYGTDNFSRNAVQRLAETASTEVAHPLQPDRAAALYKLLKDKTEAELIAEQQKLMTAAFERGVRVFFAGTANAVRDFRRRFVPENRFDVQVSDRWQEPGEYRMTRWMRSGSEPPPWAARRPDARPPSPIGSEWQLIEILPKPTASASEDAPRRARRANPGSQ